ncbi:MAG TPA: DUF4129 domain-containing protein [Gaiellaceae bacterium]|nr:DUF4129 domain-containing protein [Gaiellaceae bacterium]
MSRRLLLPLGIGVTVLLVLAGIASHGRPLAGTHRGPGPSSSFFDYVFTTAALVAVLVVAVVVWALTSNTGTKTGQRRQKRSVLAMLLFVAASAALAYLISTSSFEKRLQNAIQQAQTAQTRTAPTAAPVTAPEHPRGARLRWDEVAIVLGILGGLAALLVVERARRRKAPLSWRRASQEAVSLALDESLDDLRADPDLRRAIIAAYARMERALGGAGLPRRPSEAPLEYTERALRELETSGASVRRLTDLFEWAKFSHHEPEPAMRDDAIDALVAVRDELRAPAAAPEAEAA